MATNTNSKQLSANQLTNVKNIKDIFLYTKNNYVLCYLRIFSYNLDLLSMEERKAKTANLSASFDGDRKDFVYTTYPREIDLDSYKNSLKSKYSEELTDLGRKHLLQEMIYEAAELASNGENYEHQHFIKIWKSIGSEKTEAEKELRQRAEEFRARYEMVGIHAEILKSTEILKMCNLFGNSTQAPFDNVPGSLTYEPITKMR